MFQHKFHKIDSSDKKSRRKKIPGNKMNIYETRFSKKNSVRLIYVLFDFTNFLVWT